MFSIKFRQIFFKDTKKKYKSGGEGFQTHNKIHLVGGQDWGGRSGEPLIVSFFKQLPQKKVGSKYDEMLQVVIPGDRNTGVCCFIVCVFSVF